METYTVYAGRIRMTCPRSIPPETAMTWIERQGGMLLGGDGARPAAARRSIARVTIDGFRAVVKRDAPGLLSSILDRATARSSRPARAFRIGLELEAHGVSAPRPLALCEDAPLGVIRRSALLLESIDGLTLREFLLARLPEGGEDARDRLKRDLWDALAAVVARLHAVPARQRDLKAPNILVRELSGRLEVSLLDLEGMALLAAPPSSRARARDLARLAVSLRSDEIRAAGVGGGDWVLLVRRYLEESEKLGGLPPLPALTRFVDQTLAWALRKEARNRRRGRVIH